MFNRAKINEQIKALIIKGNLYLNASQNKQKATAYLYVIFSLLALSFFGLFAIGPTISTITDLNKKYEEEKVALKELQNKNNALKSLSSQYIDIQSDLPLIDNAIPQSAKVAQLTREIENLTIENNLVVKKLDTGLLELYPTKNVNNPTFSFTFTLGVEGAEKDVDQFITQIVNIGRIIGIDKLQSGQQQASNAYAVSITGRVYFYRAN